MVYHAAGNGSVGAPPSPPSDPNNISSKVFILASSTFVLSIVNRDVGLLPSPGTSTGVVVYSHENVIASGESDIVD